MQHGLHDGECYLAERVRSLLLTAPLQLATTAQTVVPTATTYGQYPYLCGTNTGYHC